MLDLRRLQALQAVVASGSVKEAAARLGYTPSAISQHVTTLEQETGTVLLERAGRGVRATQTGLLLAEHAASLLGRMAEAEAALAALKAGELGLLRLASFATAGAALVPPALAIVRRELPGLRISLRVADPDDALPMLRQGLLDMAVVEAHALPRPGAIHDAVALDPLLSDPFRIVLPRGHALARKRVIRLADTAGQPWVDVRCEVGCCRVATDAAFGQAGFAPRRSVEADEYWAAQGFVAAGLGLALIPTLALGVLHPGVAVRRLDPAGEPVRHVLAATRPAVADTAGVATMLAALRSTAADQVRHR